MESFGSLLLAARLGKGLSQAELGGDRYSGSYISHLEKGRRAATPEVVDYLASQLEVDPAQLTGSATESATSGPGALSVAISELQARSAWEERDFSSTIRLADQARQAAVKDGRPSSWWACTHLKAQAQLAMESYGDCVVTTQELLGHHFTRGVPELESEALVLASRATRAGGRLEDAHEFAERAVAAAVAAPAASPQRCHALLAQLASLGELGKLTEAESTAEALREIRDSVDAPHLRGLIAWSLGNLAILSGRVAEGVAEHDAAALLLNPASDLRAWGRFCKASAAMRLSSGTTDGVADLLVRARHAIDLVGNEGDRHELTLDDAELSLLAGDPEDALTAASDLPYDGVPAHLGAATCWLRYRCLAALGREAEAADAATRAAELFEEAGAIPRALEAWRAQAAIRGPRDA